jgi:hypothetical protein
MTRQAANPLLFSAGSRVLEFLQWRRRYNHVVAVYGKFGKKNPPVSEKDLDPSGLRQAYLPGRFVES